MSGVLKLLSVKTLDTVRRVADLVVRQLTMHGQHKHFLEHLFRSWKIEPA